MPHDPDGGRVRPARLAALRPRAAAAALAGALALGGLAFTATGAFQAPDSDDATLRGFQIRVLNISQAVSENRMDGALAALDALAVDLDAAGRDGRISARRLLGIESALTAVRADIAGQLESQAAVAGAATVPGAAGAAPAEAAATSSLQVSGGPADAPPAVPDAGGQDPEGPVSEGPAPARENRGKGKGPDRP